MTGDTDEADEMADEAADGDEGGGTVDDGGDARGASDAGAACATSMRPSFDHPPPSERYSANRRECLLAPGLVQGILVLEIRLLRGEHVEKVRRAALVEFGRKMQGPLRCRARGTELVDRDGRADEIAAGVLDILERRQPVSAADSVPTRASGFRCLRCRPGFHPHGKSDWSPTRLR